MNVITIISVSALFNYYMLTNKQYKSKIHSSLLVLISILTGCWLIIYLIYNVIIQYEWMRKVEIALYVSIIMFHLLFVQCLEARVRKKEKQEKKNKPTDE